MFFRENNRSIEFSKQAETLYVSLTPIMIVRTASLILMVCGSFLAILIQPGLRADSSRRQIKADLRSNKDNLMLNSIGKLDLSFEPNNGQFPSNIKFVSRGLNNSVIFNQDKIVFRFPDLSSAGEKAQTKNDSDCRKTERNKILGCSRQMRNKVNFANELTMNLVGSKRTSKIEGAEKLAGTINYFVGNNSKNWHSGIPTYRKVVYHSVYSGIDQEFYGTEKDLEFDFIVAPGANPEVIEIKFKGQKKINIGEQGDLLFQMKTAEYVQLHKPIAYQTVNGAKQTISAEYEVKPNGHVRLKVGEYDRRLPLVIDPVLSYSSYLGGSGVDSAYGIAADADGNVYVTGVMNSNEFTNLEGTNVFVAKLNADGTQRTYLTIIAANGDESGLDIYADADGSAYVTGVTSSPNFPQVNASQPGFGGGEEDGFIAKLSPTGSALTYSTYIGGTGYDAGFGITADSSGIAYVTGYTESSEFSSIPGSNAFVAKIAASGSERLYLSILGGDADDVGNSIAVGQDGSVYVAGSTNSPNFTTANAMQPVNAGSRDGFFAKVNPVGSGLTYSTYFGGSGNDQISDIAINATGEIFAVGTTNSPELSTLGGRDVFVGKFSANGNERVFMAILGGGSDDTGQSIALDSSGSIFVTGSTSSSNFTKANALQENLAGSQDAFVAKLNPLGSSLIFSTYLGGLGEDLGYGVAVDNQGGAYVTGSAKSNNLGGQFPYGGNGDAFVQKITDSSRRAVFDFDGDGKTDISIFRPSGGTGSEWWWLKSSTGGNAALRFGTATDRLAPVDFTADGKTDVAFWRPETGEWFVLRSEDFSFYAFPFGSNGDVPVPGDFDGDGRADAAVFRPTTLTWYISKSTGGTDIVGFGASGDKPVVADYDGDGKADIAVFRPNGANGAEWWIRRSSNATVFATQFGSSTDKAVPADYTGDGKADVAFWTPSSGNWFVLRSEDFSYFAFPFGSSTDIPAPGDYDGDGKMDAAVFRQSTSTWYANRSTAGVLIQQFGQTGDVPVPNAYVR